MPTIVKLLHKNVSTGQKTTVSVPQQDTTLLWERERTVCLFDKIVTNEEVLLSINTIVHISNETAQQDNNILIGEKERFLIVKYVRDDDTIKSTEESFRETLIGTSKSQQFANIKVNSTGNQFFNTNKTITNNNIIKSVCTDGLYVDNVNNYSISLKQTMYNKILKDYLDDFIVYYEPDNNVSQPNTENFTKLFIPQVNQFPYQLKANFYGVDNNFASNKFWVLPDQFKSNGLTYEIYLEGEKQRIFKDITDICVNAISYVLNNNIITIDISGLGQMSFFSYIKEKSFTEEANSKFRNFLNYDISVNSMHKNVVSNINDLSYDDIITISSKIKITNDNNELVPSVSFSINNNISDGLVGYYHELDNTKTIQNSSGFYDTTITDREEQIGSYLNSLINIYWYTGILNESTYNSNIYNTGFNFTLNDPRSINEFSGGTSQKFNFIAAERENLKDILGGFNGKDFSFNNVQFYGSTGAGIDFVDCDFRNATFTNCDFSGCTFENCDFTNVISNNNTWSNYYNMLIDINENHLGFGFKFLNGSFIGSTIDMNNIDNNYTFIRIRPNTKTFNNGYKSDSTKKIYNTIELSNNEVCDTYNIRSIIEIEENVKLELSLNQITFNNEHIDLDTNEKMSSLFLPVTSQPIVFQIKEDPSVEDTNIITDRIFIHENNLIQGITATNFYRVFTNYMSGNPLYSGNDNRVKDYNFYEHQFQKDFTNPTAPKIVGYGNTIDFDHPHKGAWALSIFPYNTINNKDNILTYGLQDITDSFYELSNNDLSINDLDNDPDWSQQYYGMSYTNSNGNVPEWTRKNGGPLPYYRLDTRFTHKYFKHPTHDVSFGRFRIRIGNNNYKYVDKTSINVLTAGQQVESINMKSNAVPDLSSNPPVNLVYAPTAETYDSL